MTINEIFKNVNTEYSIIIDNFNEEIDILTLSSKKTSRSSIFFAVKGFKTDGHRFIRDAYNHGCRTFVVEHTDHIDTDIYNCSTILIVRNIRLAFALANTSLFGNPSRDLKMIGITGTKGKSSVTDLTNRLLSENLNTAMLSTIKNVIAGRVYQTDKTTLESDILQGYLLDAKAAGSTHAIVEVSSHAVTLHRIGGIEWDCCVFTSFSRDHLDLYGSMENYFDAKVELFRNLNCSGKKNRSAFVNIDDPKGHEVCRELHSDIRLIRVGRPESFDTPPTLNDFVITDPLSSYEGIKFTLKRGNSAIDITTHMRGEFNINNIALAVAIALENGIEPVVVQRVISEARGVDGRFQIVISSPYIAIVDYAHSPDSLTKILEEARKIVRGRLIVVFGCTGDRDKEKRPIMGGIAAKLADYTLVTNDDTYTEDPAIIAADVVRGLIESGKRSGVDYSVILDRKKALKEAILGAREGDVIVAAGMGHQTKQILKDGPVEYSDTETILSISREISDTKQS